MAFRRYETRKYEKLRYTARFWQFQDQCRLKSMTVTWELQELMPFAKGVSAKSHEFDAEGNETHTDFYRMMKIVKDSGYKGWIDVEYEGTKLSEPEGIMATKKLLEKLHFADDTAYAGNS